MNNKKNILLEYLREPGIWLTMVILIGFVIGAGRVDELGIREGDVSVGDSGKVVRAISVIFAGMIGLFYALNRKALKYFIYGGSKYMMMFFMMCIASTVFSPIPLITLFKSFEIFVAIMIMTLLYASNDPYGLSKKFVIALMLIYAITSIGVYIQFAIYGAEGQRQLIGVTPLFGFMLMSKYPGMVGNALGYLGALVALFGIYLTATYKSNDKNRLVLGSIVFVLGFTVTFFSYTRSVLVFLFLSIFIYFLYRKKYIFNIIMIALVIFPLFLPPVQDKILDHMRRGDDEQALTSMSGRTHMWQEVFDRRVMRIMVGGGYATGAKFMNYEKTGQLLSQSNVHNGFLEVVMSIGLIGGAIWLFILVRASVQFYVFYKKARYRINRSEYNFHIFMMAVLFLSLTRSLMNSTFVYLDYFYPVMMAFIVYGDSLKMKMKELRSHDNNDSVMNNAEPELFTPDDIYRKKRLSVLNKID